MGRYAREESPGLWWEENGIYVTKGIYDKRQVVNLMGCCRMGEKDGSRYVTL